MAAGANVQPPPHVGLGRPGFELDNIPITQQYASKECAVTDRKSEGCETVQWHTRYLPEWGYEHSVCLPGCEFGVATHPGPNSKDEAAAELGALDELVDRQPHA